MLFANVKRNLNRANWALIIASTATFVVLMNYVDYYLPGQGLHAPANNTAWMGFAVVLFVGACVIGYFSRIKMTTVHYAYLIFIAMLLLPLLYTNNEFLQYEYLTILAIIAAFLTFLIVSQFPQCSFKKRLLIVLYASSLVQTAWGLVQYYFIYESSLLFLPADFHIAVGAFNQQNVFCSYLNMGSLLALYFFFKTKKPSVYLLLATLLVLVLNAHLNVLAEARSGRLVSLTAILMYATFCAFAYKKYLLPLVFFLLSLVFSVMPKQWFEIRPNQVVEMPLTIVKTLGTRPIIYKLAGDLVLEKPFIGYGLGQVRLEFAKQVGLYRQTHDDYRSSKQLTHMHNEILQWMVQFGIVSAGALVFLFGVWVWGMLTRRLEPSILLLGLPFLGHSLLEFPFYSSTAHLLAFSSILALAIKSTPQTHKINNSVSIAIVAITMLISAQVVSFMYSSLKSSKALLVFDSAVNKNLAILDSVKPTVTFEKWFTLAKFEYKLEKGFKTGTINQDDILDFIAWAEHIKGYFPVNKIYVRLAQSYIISNNHEAAKRIINEAELLFPDDPQVTHMLSEMRKYLNR